MATQTTEYIDTEVTLFEGSQDRPGKPRYVWTIDSVEPDGAEDENGRGTFYLVQRVAGAWETVEGRDWQVRWVPRPANFPPITRLIYAYLDDSGSIVNVNRRD